MTPWSLAMGQPGKLIKQFRPALEKVILKMATPMTASQFLAQLDRWGIKYRKDFNDWATHNRGDRGNGWGPVHGIIQHHTGADDTSPEFLHNGSIKLPGPLCHVGNDSTGILHLIGWGRANHAGGGDKRTLNHVINQDYGSHILVPQFGEGDAGAYDGNGVFYGIENIYSGKHSMTPKQYDTAVLFAAAICEFHHWGPLSTIGHGEWSNQKWDPSVNGRSMMDMVAFRRDVANALFDGPGKGPGTAPAFPGIMLEPGITSKWVTMLDEQLINIGYSRYYNSGPGPYFGKGTTSAVMAYKKKHPELLINGYATATVGPKTWNSVFRSKS